MGRHNQSRTDRESRTRRAIGARVSEIHELEDRDQRKTYLPTVASRGSESAEKAEENATFRHSENGCAHQRSDHPDDVWAWDVIFDRTTSGTPLKWLVIVDEFTRESLCLHVDRSITSEDVINELSKLFASRGIPNHTRSDNGPEFTAKAISSWLELLGLDVLYIQPGSPWENGFAESFNSRFRDEFLSLEEFDSLQTAKALTSLHREEYNDHRPHSSLGYLPPNEFASQWPASVQSAALPSLQLATATEDPSPITQPELS